MKTVTPDKLVYMVNQIGKFYAHKNDEDAIAGIAEHIESFWEKRMKAAIFRHLDAEAAGLEERAKQALLRLQGQRRPFVETLSAKTLAGRGLSEQEMP